MSEVEKRLNKIGLYLPENTKPIASYIPAKKSGKLIFTSGQLPMVNGELTCTGLLGREVELEQAKRAANICTLNALAAIKSIIHDLDQITQIVRLVGYVASEKSFVQQSLVINGASDLLLEIFGETGRHARSAVGVISLPLNASVEIELMVEIK